MDILDAPTQLNPRSIMRTKIAAELSKAENSPVDIIDAPTQIMNRGLGKAPKKVDFLSPVQPKEEVKEAPGQQIESPKDKPLKDFSATNAPTQLVKPPLRKIVKQAEPEDFDEIEMDAPTQMVKNLDLARKQEKKPKVQVEEDKHIGRLDGDKKQILPQSQKRESQGRTITLLKCYINLF